MAYIADDEKQKENQLGQQQPDLNQQAQTYQGGAGGIAGNGAAQGSAGASSNGTGGQASPWTNIQDYVTANQGNNASADMLNQKVGEQFNQEQGKLQSQAADATKKAQDQVSQNNIGQDQASKLIQQASSNYSYNGKPTDAYSQAINPLKQAVTGAYQGPTQFNYSLGNQAQQYGSALQNGDMGFNSLMNSLYGQSGPMGAGQYALQQQLDQNNPSIQQARQNLTGQYGALQKNLGDTQASTNASLANAQKAYGDNEDQLKKYLQTQATGDRGSIDQAVNNWNTVERKNSDGLRGVQHVDLGGGLGADLNADPYWNSAGSQFVTDQNVGGVGTQRNEYNTLMDALGMGGQIQQADNPVTKHGGFDWDRWKNDYSNIFG